MTVREILVRLLELTPEPPPGEVDQLLAGFDAMLARRAEVIAALAPPVALADADRPLWRELQRRDDAWQAALTAARQAIGTQRRGAAQLRAYAPHP